MTLKFDGWPRKTIGHLFYTSSSFVHHFKAIGEFKLKSQSGNAQFGSKLGIFLSRVTLKFDWWCWKTIGNVFYVASSFVHHFIAISELKIKLQSGNAQVRTKSAIFFYRVTLKLDGWPSKTIGQLYYATSSFVHHFVAIGEFKLELQSGNAQFGSKTMIVLAVWPWNLTDDLQKHMLCTAQLGGPILRAFGRVQKTPFQLVDKSPMITDQHTAGGSVSQLSQLAKLSPWLTLSTKDITTSFWHYNKLFCFFI